MCLRKTRRFFVLLFSSLALLSLKAQTLYWVGGSGNFNDPQHWSLTSGGPAANLVPNSGTDVIFDDKSGTNDFSLKFGFTARINSIRFINQRITIEVTGDNTSELRIKGDFLLSQKTIPSFKTKILFEQNPEVKSLSDIDFFGHTLKSDVDFISGNWNLKDFSIGEEKSVRFLAGNYHLQATVLNAGNFISNAGVVKFFTDVSIINVKNKFHIGRNTAFKTNSTVIKVDKDNLQNYVVDSTVNFGSSIVGKGYGTGVVNAACGLTLTGQNPTCPGSNDGKLFISIDPSCAGTYTLQFTGGCSPPPNTTVVAGGSYTISGLSGCGSAYKAVLLLGTFPVAASNNQLVTAPVPISFFPFSPVEPLCFGNCNGSFSVLWGDGTPPYTIIHTPPGQPQYTTTNVPSSIVSYTGLCAGLNTFSVTDFNGCSASFTYALSQPSVLTAASTVTNVTCNTYSNGALSVSPQGGTPNYTVNFSTGPSQVTGTLGTVSSTGLPPGPITATVTDANGCQAFVNQNITQPLALNATPSQTNVQCNGNSNGAASVLVSGGTPGYNFSWSPASGSSSVITGLSAGTQTVTITDNNLCTQTVAFNITQPPSITLTPTHTNVVCSGSCTGVASVAATGGAGVFTFTWVAPGNSTISTGATNSLSNLCAGAYTVYSKDSPNNCTNSVVITITQPPSITLTAVSQSITCFGASNGGATVSASGGNGAPFAISWSPGGSTSFTINGLGPNTYTAVVSDASLCTTQTQVIIVEPAGLNPVVTHTDLTCNVANKPCDGIINSQPTGGTAPYSYTLTTTGSTITTVPPYTNLCAGNYVVIVKDLSGCPQQVSVTLTQPNPISPSVSTTSLNCFNDNSGALTGNPGTGGSGTYTLTWATPLGPATGATLTGQPAGNYTFFVIDTKSCTAQATATVTQPTSITVNVNTATISCFAVCNGVLTATVSGGTAPYNYTWTSSSGPVGGNSPTVSGLCPGPYTLTIKDFNLCTRTVVANVTSPPAITLTPNTTGVKCFGDSNGSATVTAGGGTPSFTFQFNSTPTVSNTTGVLTGQPAGNYTATITDLAGCTATAAFAITSPTALAAILNGAGSCNVCSGTATMTPSFGTPTYTYSWASSAGGTFPATPTLGNLCPATYTATVTDLNGCTIAKTITLTQIISVTVSLGGGNSILCNGFTTGSATALPSGGTGIYTYSWSPSGQTSQTLTGAGATSYTVKVTDTSTPVNCSHTAAVTFTQPPAMTVTATQTNVTCFGSNNGAISATVTGGTLGSGYHYTWTPGPITGSTIIGTSSITGILAGTYTLDITDGNLCPFTKTISVTEPSSITIALSVTHPSGCSPALANGSICITPTGGAGGNYQYTLNPSGATFTGTSACFTGLGGGAYSIIVKDSQGCSNSTVTTLIPPNGPTLTVNSVSVACYGYSTGIITATATGILGPYQFSITPTRTFTPAGPTLAGTITASGVPAGVYFVTASDGNQCVAVQAVTVTQATAYTLNPVVTNLRCNTVHGSPSGSIVVNPSGGSPGYTYTWQPGSPTGQGTNTITNLAAGVYTLNLSDTHTCITPYTFTVTQPSSVTINATTYSLQCFNVCTGSITANGSGGTGAITYSWLPGGSTSPTVTNLCATTGTNPSSYTLIAQDANTCVVTNTYLIAQPAQLTSTINVLNATCSNSCNAVATLTASGGTPTYTYSWSSSTLTTASLGSLCAGTYTGFVTDANGCVNGLQYTVTPPPALNVTLTPSNPLCNGACNGSITTLVSGAQGTVAYSWLPGGTGQNPTGLCAAPNPIYTLTATDANSCRVTAVTTLTNPPVMLANVSFTDPLCHNNANGTASASAVNATGALTYTWLATAPTQTNQTASGLASGPYTVVIKDANNCQASQTFTLGNPGSVSVTASTNPASCLLPNGDITVNASGGTPGTSPPYTYTWSGSASANTGSVASGLLAGPYTTTVADSHGCTATVNVLLSNSNGPSTVPVVSSTITCHAQCTGAASVDVAGIAGGTAPYTVEWLSPAPSTVNPLSGLCTGTYNAKVADANGCIIFTTAIIAEPPKLVLTPTVSAPICPGICDGSVALNPTGGNSPYSYSWTTGSTNSVITGLCAGDYTLNITYNGVCSMDTVFNLPDRSSITIVPTVTNNTCFGTCLGTANASVSGGAPPYVAGWSNGQNGLTLNNLCNGNYTVIITDANGCSNTATTAITSGAQMSTSASVVSPSCGLCNGEASVTATGGTAPLTYSWSNSATTPSVNGLCAGIYQVTISDAQSCKQSHTVVINSANGITGENVNVSQIPCSGNCVGAATVTAIGGTSPITYTWVSPATGGSITSGLCPGTYYVQMKDAMQCIRIASVTINPMVTLSVSPFVYLPSCGNADGSITIVVAGGTPSYNIVWTPSVPGVTNSITGLNTGAYSYTVTESGTNSCSISNTINLSNANGPVINTIQHDLNCYGVCDGSISISSTSTSTPLTYAWSNGSVTPAVLNLCKGAITLTLTDVNLCKAFKTFTITDNPQLTLGLATVHNSQCHNDCKGSIQLVPNGGVAPYTYSWSLENKNTNPVNDLCDGVYSATVTDSKGCNAKSPDYNISSASSMSFSANTFSSSCASVADGSITLSPSGGVPGYTYTWHGPSNFSATTHSISSLFAGTYSVNVSDNLGCKKDSAFIIVPTLTVTAKAGEDRVICPETGSVVLNASSSTNSNYKWYAITDHVHPLSEGSALMVSNLSEPSSFILVATSTVPSCYAEDTVNVGLYNLPAVNAGRDFKVPVYSTVTLGGHPSIWGAVSLTWSPAMYLNDAHAENPVASNTVDVTYTLTVTDQNGCIASDSVHVFLFPELLITSGFTPNGDGKNDYWVIDYIDQFPATTVEIYNRWGDLLFSSTGYQTPFDGKYKGTDLPVGTYYYIINLNHPGYPKPITGPLTIFR